MLELHYDIHVSTKAVCTLMTKNDTFSIKNNWKGYPISIKCGIEYHMDAYIQH